MYKTQKLHLKPLNINKPFIITLVALCLKSQRNLEIGTKMKII